MHERFVHDPIHGLISFPQKVWDIVDTPHFQRLRDIHQMDISYYIYPGARHSRFEHSLGVGYLASKMIRTLRELQPELEIRTPEVEAVSIAGLCHDLGHGPFSHIFDNLFIPRVRPGINWTHETASQLLFEDLVDKFSIDLDSYQIKLIQDLIKGDVTDPERKFLFEIVANKLNSFDVDKFDYINRDSYYTGFKDSFNHKRIFKQCQVIDDHICYNRKEVFNIWELFQKRYSLFKRVYTHPTSQSIQLMIVDALVFSDPFMKFSSSIDSVENYITFTDGILGEINRSSNPALIEAKGILSRIQKRHLYKLMVEKHIPSNFDLHNFKTSLALIVDISDLEFLIASINYGLKDRNPMKEFLFFDTDNLKCNSKLSHLDSFQMDVSFTPVAFEEKILRVFCKNPKFETQRVEAIEKFIDEYLLSAMKQ